MTFGVSPPPDAAVANPWLRINRALRVMLHTHWSTAAWAEVRVEFRKALAPDGMKAWRQVVERGYEGYVAKDEASVYQGGPTRRWLKVKQKDWTVDGDGWRLRFATRRSRVHGEAHRRRDERASRGIRRVVLSRAGVRESWPSLPGYQLRISGNFIAATGGRATYEGVVCLQ